LIADAGVLYAEDDRPEVGVTARTICKGLGAVPTSRSIRAAPTSAGHLR